MSEQLTIAALPIEVRVTALCVCNVRKYDHDITQKWPEPINNAHKILNNGAPEYLKEIIEVNTKNNKSKK